MKIVIVRCDDLVRHGEAPEPLLAGAKMAHLAQLAQAGSGGMIRHPGRPQPFDHFQVHRAMFGLDVNEPIAQAGPCYAAGLNRQLSPGETGWSCQLLTHDGGKIIDPDAGNITTSESRALIQQLNETLGSDTRHWEVGEGSQHLLITRDPSLSGDGLAAVPAPELLVGRSWRRQLPKGPQREPLAHLIHQGAKCLEAHPVNRVRVDLGENPANIFWLWGAGGSQSSSTFEQRSGMRGGIISRGFALRGLTRVLGAEWHDAPKRLDEQGMRGLFKTVTTMRERCDFTYVHIAIRERNAVERLCIMERIDQLLCKPLTESLGRLEAWRFAALIDNRDDHTIAFVAMGSGLPQHPVPKLTASHLAESACTVEEPAAFHRWFLDGR